MNSRTKGKRGELEIAKILREHGFPDAKRGQQFSGLYGDADVVGVKGLHLEVKRVEALNIEKAMEQSIRDAREGEIPTVFHRKNGKPWLVTLGIEDFLEIYKRGQTK